MRTRLLAATLTGAMLFFALAAAGPARGGEGVRRMPGEDVHAAWILDSTLEMPFALVALPSLPEFSAEGNVAWAHMPPVSMYSMWVRFVNPHERILVEIAVPVAVFREPWDAAGPPLRHDAAGVLRTFVRPILAAVSPGAEIGDIRESADPLLLEATRLDLAKREAPFLTAGRAVRDSRADAAEMTVKSGALQTRFIAAAWSFLFERDSPGDFSPLGKWTALLCVTSPAGKDVPDEKVWALLDGIRINPEWQAEADKELAELTAIEESPPFSLPEEKERWNAMNRSGAVFVPLPSDRYPEVFQGEYVPPHPKHAYMLPGNRYTYVNAAIDGCFLGFRATAKSVDIENINPLALFP